MDTDDKRHINDLADMIVHYAYDFYSWKIYEAIDRRDLLPHNYSSFSNKIMDEILKKADDMLKTAQQTRKIQAQSTNDIVKMLAKGKITIDEAERLMKLVDKKKELDFEF